MTRGQEIIETIKSVFARIREKCPLIADEDLRSNGAIFYMNGDNGTDFDWNINDHTSEFYMYHENKVGFIKLYVNRGDTYTAYVYPNGEMRAVATIKGDLDEGDSSYLATLLYYKADREHIYDAIIDEIDFSYEPDKWKLQEMENKYDEDEE